MTDEEIRSIIANQLGTTDPHWWCPRCGRVESSHVTYEERHDIDFCMELVTCVETPNYPESLDACAQFEKTLTLDESWEYAKLLMDYKQSANGFPLASKSEVFNLQKATPIERCIAYLKTKGLIYNGDLAPRTHRHA